MPKKRENSRLLHAFEIWLKSFVSTKKSSSPNQKEALPSKNPHSNQMDSVSPAEQKKQPYKVRLLVKDVLEISTSTERKRNNPKRPPRNRH